MPPRIDGPTLDTYEAIKSANGTQQQNRSLMLPAVQAGSFLVDGTRYMPLLR